MANTNVAYPVLGTYLILVLGAGILAAFVNRLHIRRDHGDKVGSRLDMGLQNWAMRGSRRYCWVSLAKCQRKSAAAAQSSCPCAW